MLTSDGATCGGIAVPLGHAREFLRCWAGALDMSRYDAAVVGERGRSQAKLRFPRFCGLGCDKGKDSHEEQEERSALRPRV